MSQLVEACNTSDHVTAERVHHTDFHDYDKFLSKMYKKFPPGGILQFQKFLAGPFKKEDDQGNKWTKDPCKVVCRSSNLPDANEKTVIMQKGATKKSVCDFLTIDGETTNRYEVVNKLQPEPLYEKAPGLSARKEVEMFTKWRPNVPEKYWEETCPEPSPETYKKVKAEIQKKRLEREKKKKHTPVVSSSKRKAPTADAALRPSKKR